MKHIICSILLIITTTVFAQQIATGVVFHDLNKNKQRDKGEPGIANVCVSNGKEVAKTDKSGKWVLPSSNDAGFFVIKPADYSVPLNVDNLPQHYYLHKPDGSPTTKSIGVAPTGSLPMSIDFPLWAQKPEKKFSVMLFSDTQTRGLTEVNYVTRDVVEECIGTNARFGISLGDIVADDPNLFAEMNQSISQIGIPWYNIFGNHDFNRGATDNLYSDETFERFYGPSSYAFEEGEVVFIGLKNVYFSPDGKYKGHFTEEQLAFVKNYLSLVPHNKLVVLMMHIPVVICDNRTVLFDIIQKRPYAFSVSGHTHTTIQLFVDEKYGWKGTVPHHHFVNTTVSGSWWCGLKDEVGIPHATMNDGAPNGYSIVTFDGNKYSVQFKAARRPANYQMNIYWPDEVSQAASDTLSLLVNVFAGSARSKVEFQINQQPTWIPLQLTPTRDPANQAMHELSPYLEAEVKGTKLDKVLGWTMDKPSISTHIWAGKLPTKLSVGTHRITIKTTDMYGQTYVAYRVFRVNP